MACSCHSAFAKDVVPLPNLFCVVQTCKSNERIPALPRQIKCKTLLSEAQTQWDIHLEQEQINLCPDKHRQEQDAKSRPFLNAPSFFYETQGCSLDLDNLHGALPAEGRKGLRNILAPEHFWIKLEKVMKLTVVILDLCPEAQFKWSMESKWLMAFSWLYFPATKRKKL